MKHLHGIGASGGIAIAPLYCYRDSTLQVDRATVDDSLAEWERLQAALQQSVAQLEELAADASRRVGADNAQVFEAQAVMLRDPELLKMVQTRLFAGNLNVETVWLEACEHYAGQLDALDDPYLRARAADVRDAAQRVLHALLGVTSPGLTELLQPVIVVADSLSPSDTMGLDRSRVLGFVTARGGETSHSAILARSLGLPAVVGAGEAIFDGVDGMLAILDGSEGLLLIDPDVATLADYRRRQQVERERWRQALAQRCQPVVSTDGCAVTVLANIGSLAGAERALEAGAEGAGLLRTEFLYLERGSLPDEDEQVEVYRNILETFGEKPVYLRTLDIGGDKELPYLALAPEKNPALGLRGIRLSLAQGDWLKVQLRAALRAGAGRANLKIILPMVTDVSEVRRVRALLALCCGELAAEGVPFAPGVPLGCMVEVPAAALMADELAREVDFLAIGTNDLTQYTLAADRASADLAYLGGAFAPAVLRLVRQVIRSGRAAGKPLSLCGDLAGDPLAAPLLLGLELRSFSMEASAIPLVKQTLSRLSAAACVPIAAAALELDGAAAVKDHLKAALARL
ncbi:MAG: phosphoenolpyruvate--protein phosphotransferase [Anaerolineae bacterium]|nr:phosphoenolpyruvate--protein phosphotransferase [Anaerolineae bacterium]